jgi:endo-1,4-beta-xylanase
MNIPRFIQDANGVPVATLTRKSLQGMLKNHIDSVFLKYKGRIAQWDLVNEPFAEPSTTGAMRTNVWQTVIGSDYIDSAFVWAHRVDPACKLYLNDYNCETVGSAKAEYMYEFIAGMKARNIPIDGVGFQCHINTNGMNYTTLDQNIKRYAALGLDVAITELDVSISNVNYANNSASYLTKQALIYQNIIQLCLNNPNCKTFITWGFTDLYSWIPDYSAGFSPSGHALIFDTDYNPKPAYNTILNALNTKSSK